MRLDDIITGIVTGMVQDGDVFEAESNGDRLIYKDGVLSWLTIGGYISNPVTVTSENIDESYKIVKQSERVKVKTVKRYVDCGKKLTKEDVFNIHLYYHNVGLSIKKLSEKYKVSQRMVYYILEGVHWGEVYKAFHKMREL